MVINVNDDVIASIGHNESSSISRVEYKVVSRSRARRCEVSWVIFGLLGNRAKPGLDVSRELVGGAGTLKQHNKGIQSNPANLPPVLTHQERKVCATK